MDTAVTLREDDADIDSAARAARFAPSDDDPCANFAHAFALAESVFGVPQLLDPDDPECCGDEQSMLTYLSEARNT